MNGKLVETHGRPAWYHDIADGLTLAEELKTVEYLAKDHPSYVLIKTLYGRFIVAWPDAAAVSGSVFMLAGDGVSILIPLTMIEWIRSFGALSFGQRSAIAPAAVHPIMVEP